MGKKFYITTTIPYVNAAPHIGHALEFVQADIIARYHRAQEDKVYFLSGSDENAIKNVQAAEKTRVPIEEFVAKNSEAFKNILSSLNVSIDQFIRTTEDRHKKGAQALWLATKPEDIYKKTYKGLYCVGCELFYKPEELNEKGECFEHPGKKVELVEEENYFFKLRNYADWLLDLIKSGKLKITPDIRKNEVLSFIERGLEDFSISRPLSRSKNWGVPVPGDANQTIYVWYDALANYITALGYPDKETSLYSEFWAGEGDKLHVLGKGVSRFHAIYWPAMLKSAGLPLPNSEFIHGYITVNGQKISKTLGNVIDPVEVIQKYGADTLRYWFTREASTFGDSDFTWEKFKESYNANLANGLGNLASRIMKMVSIIASMGETNPPVGFEFPVAGGSIFLDYCNFLDNFEIKKAADLIWEKISNLDIYIQENEPFKKIKTDLNGAKSDMKKLIMELATIAYLLQPFMPETSRKILEAVKSGKEITPLFPRIS